MSAMNELGEFIVLAVLSALELPGESGWVFDGFRRIYTDGKPSGWVARMVDTSSYEPEGVARYVQGNGTTMHEAMLDMGKRRKEML